MPASRKDPAPGPVPPYPYYGKETCPMIRFLLECRRLFEKYSKDEMSVYAAQASFFIILASIPFLMLLLSPDPGHASGERVRSSVPGGPDGAGYPGRPGGLCTGQSPFRLSHGPFVSHGHCSPLVLLPGNVKHRAGLKPGLGHRDPEKLYRPPDHLRRIYSPFFPHVSFCAWCSWCSGSRSRNRSGPGSL